MDSIAITAKLTPITGGYHVKDAGEHCIDVLMMMYNWRIVLSPKTPEAHACVDAAFCYFGHGFYPDGQPRDMNQAFLRAVMAAEIWDGHGEPVGYDKRAF